MVIAQFGFRDYSPLSFDVPRYTGSIASVNLSYVAFESTRLGVIIGRDIQNSVDFNQPYYLQTGITASIEQQICGPLDVQGRIGNQRLAYRDRAGSVAVPDREDKVRSNGAGIGIDSAGICDSGSTSTTRTGNRRSMIAGTRV